MDSRTRLRYLIPLAFVLLVVALVMNWNLVMQSAAIKAVDAAGSGSATKTREQQSFLKQFDTDNLTIPKAEILRGGPAKDGIPAITAPNVKGVALVNFLSPGDRVVGIVVNGEARAYPIRLLNWHEVINDQLGSIPLAVIYCPLCDSVSVMDRRIENKTLEFGVSGLLHNSNVLLYDRTDKALWSQVGFEAVSGPHAGRALWHLPFQLTSYEHWSAVYPDSSVATFETGFRRNYDTNPYGSYFAGDDLMFPVKDLNDRRLRHKEPVVGIRIGNEERAYPLSRVAEMPNGRVEERLTGGWVVIEVPKGGQDVRIIEVPEDALVVHTFWFAWSAFHPETTIFEPKRH